VSVKLSWLPRATPHLHTTATPHSRPAHNEWRRRCPPPRGRAAAARSSSTRRRLPASPSECWQSCSPPPCHPVSPPCHPAHRSQLAAGWPTSVSRTSRGRWQPTARVSESVRCVLAPPCQHNTQHCPCHPAVPVEHLAKLGVLLGRNWQKAIAVVDANEVHCFEGEPSGRRIFEVQCACWQLCRALDAGCVAQAWWHWGRVVPQQAVVAERHTAATLAWLGASRACTRCVHRCRARAGSTSRCPRATAPARRTTMRSCAGRRRPT
jgi:hypothetical protein